MKNTPIVGLFALMLVLLASACKKDFKTTEDGLKYMIAYQSDTGEVAGEGGYLKMHIKMIAPVEIKQDDSSIVKKDSVITDSYADSYGPAEMLVSKPTYKGCINGGFATLRSGDSVIYKVLADSLYLKTFGRPLPSFLKGGEELTVIVKVLESLTKEGFEKKQKAEQEETPTTAGHHIQRIRACKTPVQPHSDCNALSTPAKRSKEVPVEGITCQKN